MRTDDSSSIPADSNPPPGHQPPFQSKPFEPPIANRIARAFHYLKLLHRSDPNFAVLGASGNVYTVTLSITPSCTCPDRTIPCKHILFVYLRVLGVSLDDTCLREATLKPSQITQLLVSPTNPESFAGDRVREKYHQLIVSQSRTASGVVAREPEVGEGSTCPICLEEMRMEDRVVACGSCRNSVHEECLQKWKRIKRRSITTCVICREMWRDSGEQEGYLNLAAYVSDDEDVDA